MHFCCKMISSDSVEWWINCILHMLSLQLSSVVKGGRDNYEEEELSETMIERNPEE
jgi:hypothetical protein